MKDRILTLTDRNLTLTAAPEASELDRHMLDSRLKVTCWLWHGERAPAGKVKVELDARCSNPTEGWIMSAFAWLHDNGVDRPGIEVMLYDDDTYGGTYASGYRDPTAEEREAIEREFRLRQQTDRAEKVAVLRRALADDPTLADEVCGSPRAV